uniref:Secreted protein n=1 Tax=Steinernema glaseri TaxID=37863 RepID=A0A1I7ZBZ0_9BILA
MSSRLKLYSFIYILTTSFLLYYLLFIRTIAFHQTLSHAWITQDEHLAVPPLFHSVHLACTSFFDIGQLLPLLRALIKETSPLFVRSQRQFLSPTWQHWEYPKVCTCGWPSPASEPVQPLMKTSRMLIITCYLRSAPTARAQKFPAPQGYISFGDSVKRYRDQFAGQRTGASLPFTVTFDFIRPPFERPGAPVIESSSGAPPASPSEHT